MKKYTKGSVLENTKDYARCDLKFEEALKQNGYKIKGFIYNHNDTRYFLTKNNLEIQYLFPRGNARKERIQANISLLNERFNIWDKGENTF